MISWPLWSQWWDLSSEIMLICNLSKWSPFETRTPSFDREFHSASFGTCFQQLFLTSLDFYIIFRWLLGSIFGVFGINFWTNLNEFCINLGGILGVFWVILGAFWALGVLLGVQEGPKRAPRAPKSVKMLILMWFNNLKELPKSSLSALRASKIALGRSGSGPGAKN